MKTFVINLERRPDRRQWMLAILPPGIEAEFTTSWVGPIDGRSITTETLGDYGLFAWEIASTNRWWKRPLKFGEIGCAISHWLCWQRAKECDDNLFLILEDDVYLSEPFLPKLADGLGRLCDYDPDWELLYLGRVPLEPDTPAIDGIVRPGYSHCTFAYMLTRHAVEKLLATSFSKAIVPIDEFLPSMYLKHPREDVRRRFPKQLSAYAFEPSLVMQLPKSLAGSDTEDSDFVASVG